MLNHRSLFEQISSFYFNMWEDKVLHWWGSHFASMTLHQPWHFRTPTATKRKAGNIPIFKTQCHRHYHECPSIIYHIPPSIYPSIHLDSVPGAEENKIMVRVSIKRWGGLLQFKAVLKWITTSRCQHSMGTLPDDYAVYYCIETDRFGYTRTYFHGKTSNSVATLKLLST